MELSYVLCSEQLLLDANTNRITAVNILDSILTKKFPVMIPRFSFLVAATRAPNEPEKWNSRADIFMNERKLLEGPLNLDFQGSVKSRAIVVTENLLISEPGILRVIVYLNDAEFANWSLEVEQEI